MGTEAAPASTIFITRLLWYSCNELSVSHFYVTHKKGHPEYVGVLLSANADFRLRLFYVSATSPARQSPKRRGSPAPELVQS